MNIQRELESFIMSQNLITNEVDDYTEMITCKDCNFTKQNCVCYCHKCGYNYDNEGNCRYYCEED